MPRLAPSPARESLPPVPFGQCDATASGSENALVRLSGPAGQELEVCGHHFREHEFDLAAAGWLVIWDDRPDPPPRA